MTNARWQRGMVVCNLLLAAGWLVWQWPHSPLRAVAGLAAVMLLLRLFMGLQFVCMVRVNRQARRADGVPVPSLAQVVRAWSAEARWASVVFGWWQPFRSTAVPDWLPPPVTGGPPPARGVVLVHGFICNRGFWTPWMKVLRGRGHPFVAVTMEPAFGAIDDYVDTLDEAVRRVTAATGRPPVVVGHSMGGLAVRAWLRARQADARVHRVITLGSPHQGAWAARFSRSANGRQMVPGGEWLRQLAQDEPSGRAALFTCFYSNCDNAVYPAATATLDGADNRLREGLAHVQMAFHPPVVRECLDLIAAL
ncbi:alpha/beta fold hydrolase [Acidovorax sp. SUPP2522]|uniref:esterase/lipase family protein n=1 Tax=unclassified Acidovorax TaxID=2684926 RepID=UPI00234B417B|nr:MULTISPECIES: alpha/beta fold hydrolase [unclassified Acidovorax]WCM96997.1 alpha/beta fold hydrolase [Acidovorax sp. GBBC 1281]GKT15164.1 alpha/beta fold hydrolase [Acidovorax sp. SUPP2522]